VADCVDVRAINLTKVFERDGKPLTVIDNVSFEVKRGELVAIVGPSGCGKTTLLRILAGLVKPTSGEVVLDPEREQSGVALIPQSAVLLPWRTLLQNATLGMEIAGRCSAAALERVHSRIEAFGLMGFENSLPEELSGGMAQRVAVIRALESQPRILFCDEPFSAIDFVGRLDLNTRFKYMCVVQGITTVFVTHNIEEAIFLGDKIIVMSSRPAHIVSNYRPQLSVGSDDAVECRRSPEFADLFQRIWRDLKNG
jgi:NitT/TauT family transport system ATP-binding protein